MTLPDPSAASPSTPVATLDTPQALAVGDAGILRRHGGHGTDTSVRVTTVGRRWAHLVNDKGHGMGRVDKHNGQLDGRGYTSSATFYTPERLAYVERVAEARAVIKEAGLEVRLGYLRTWTDERLLALAAWLGSPAANGSEAEHSGDDDVTREQVGQP